MSAKFKIIRKECPPVLDRQSVIKEAYDESIENQLMLCCESIGCESMEMDENYCSIFNDSSEEKPRYGEEEIRYVLAPGSTRSFIFHPSFVRVYYNLKQCNTELAIEYIEALMNFGIYGTEIPDNPILKAVMDGIVETIEKSYERYVVKRYSEKYKETQKANQCQNEDRKDSYDE